MRITKKEIRQMVPEEDYERGLAYYEQDRVISYREEVTKDLAKLTCRSGGDEAVYSQCLFFPTGAYRRCVPAPALQTGTAASIWWRRF